MKKTVAVVYTLVVVIVLLGVLGYFGWKTHQARMERMSTFLTRTDSYARTLSEALIENRDVDTEVVVARQLMADDPTLVAVQIYSHDDGLRLSVVKPVLEEFSRTPITGSPRFDGPVARLRYHVVQLPLRVPDMQGLETTLVAATLTGAEIRGNLLIILITVIGLFAITLVMLLVKPGTASDNEDHETDESDESDSFSLPDEPMDVADARSGYDEGRPEHGDIGDDQGFDFADFDDDDRLNENDLFGSGPDIGDSMPLDDEFDLPDLDESPVLGTSGNRPPSMVRLEAELERAASFNQDLSLILFANADRVEEEIREHYKYPDLIFGLDDGRIAVIEINRDLDTSLSLAEELVRNCIERTGTRTLRTGIASRNGRLIGADRLFGEAESALRKTDTEKTIVAFRSDPEKYREFLRSQES